MARGIGIALALLSVLALGCSAADDLGQGQNNLADPPLYLALGDSIPFGENPPIEPANNPNQYVGYPKLVAEMIDIPQINAACPGETTESYFNPVAIDNGCDAFRDREDLHVDYSGTQMDYALGYLATHDRVKLITVQLGANDLLLLLYGCMGDQACIMSKLPDTLAAIGNNLGTVVGSLRYAGYMGQIVLPTYYSTDYRDEFTTGAIYYLNQVIAQVAAGANAQLADGFGAFYMASYAAGGDPCAAGLLLPLGDGTCDKHPSALGAQVLAQAVAAVVAQ